MRSDNRIHPLHQPLILAVLVAGLAVITSADALGRDRNEPWLIPFDIGQKRRTDPVVLQPTQEQIYEFAWDSFIALNWPYLVKTQRGGLGLRGQPDTRARGVPIFSPNNPSNTSPFVVWETYMNPGDMFIDNPDPDNYPVIWSTPNFLDIESRLRELQPPSYNGQFAPGINQPYTHANVPTGPVVDQNKNYLRYEVTMNQTYFSYVATFKYFSADVQKRVVQNYIDYAWAHNEPPPPGNPDYFQPLPVGTESYVLAQPNYAQQGLIEVKAAWKVLKTTGRHQDIPERYLRRLMRIPLPNGTYVTKLMGLVGFHIHCVTPFGHLPSTFEQVDNVELIQQPDDPLPLPETPSLNPGHGFQQTLQKIVNPLRHARSAQIPLNPDSAQYPNGYEVNGLTGQPGIIPKAFTVGDPLPPVDRRPTVNVSRAAPIPEPVQEVNRRYQAKLKDSVLRYYQLVGAQNASGTQNNPYVEPNQPYLGPGIPNYDLGPGIPGAQYSNTTNLINTTLESYTQPGFSCARCHINAFPQGVGAFPPFEERFKALHVMSFLLLNAKPEAK
jgi:hypothetical protein